jgi:hypothetical protein
MTPLKRASILLVLLAGMGPVYGPAPAAQPAWPAINAETRPWTRWWWMGNSVDEEELTAAMEAYRAAGLGGLEITPIYGVRGDEDRFIEYLSPRWMEQLSHVLREAERLGLGIDLATGTGWPFGGPWVNPAQASRYVALETYTLRGGEHLTDPVRDLQRPFVRAVGNAMDIDDLTEPITANPDLQALALDQVRFPGPLPLQVLMAYSSDGRMHDLTPLVGEGGHLRWTAPAGEWTLTPSFRAGTVRWSSGPHRAARAT